MPFIAVPARGTPSEAAPRKWDFVSQNETQGAFATIPPTPNFVNYQKNPPCLCALPAPVGLKQGVVKARFCNFGLDGWGENGFISRFEVPARREMIKRIVNLTWLKG
jgi:hypothetical protein